MKIFFILIIFIIFLIARELIYLGKFIV